MNMLAQKIMKIFTVLCLLMSFNTVSALKIANPLKLEQAWSDNLKISWEKVEGAVWYYLYYDTESKAGSWSYAQEWDDVIDWTWVTVTNLKPNTTYYVTITVIDANSNEWEKSTEWIFKTIGEQSLKLERIDIKSLNTLDLAYNLDIDNNAEKEFKIVEKEDNTVLIDVKEIKIDDKDHKKLILTLESDLLVGKNYSLTTMSLFWINGENIKTWVDGVVDFYVNKNDKGVLQWVLEWEITSSGSNLLENNNNENNIVLNAPIEKNNSRALSGENISSEDLNKSVIATGSNATNLPKTWAEHWIFILIAIVFAWLLTIVKRKQNS